ncbi:MAG: hypothetical protein ABL877_08345 [Thiobacillus sp.]
MLHEAGFAALSPATLLLAHTLFALVTALLATRLLSPQYRSSPRRAFVFHSVLAMCIPVLGGVVLIGWALYARFINRRHRERPFVAVRLPVFTAAPVSPSFSAGAGSLRPRLTRSDLARETRIEALLTVQHLPGNLSARLLREVLSDPVDDLRLSAYGMLDKGEKQINQKIEAALTQLEAETQPAARGRLYQRIAECYWELVYQDYAHQGELREFALQAAWRAAQDALPLCPQDADLLVLTGRVALARDQLDDAAQAFTQARALSIPNNRVLPYLAELAFMRRDFTETRTLVRALAADTRNFTTTPLIAFWQTGRPA